MTALKAGRLETAGLIDLVDLVVLSCELGRVKPDPEAFRIVWARGIGCR